MSFPRIEGYVVTEKIGSGSYSTVYKAYNKVGGRQTVAIKCVEKSRVKHSGAAVDNLITEIRLLKSLVHPHIVRMHNFTWDDKNIYIIMEYCSGGDLSKYIKKYGRVPETQVRYFLQQLASALKFLYDKGVVHMDLKPHNLLLHKGSDGKLTLKVADFGFAAHMVSEWSGGVRGSPLYMAPEMATGSGGPTVDLWSVGVIMYECLFGAAPYSSSTLNELLDKIQRKEQIQIPSNASITPLCRSLLHSLLQHEPARRLTYEQFFSHEYLDLEHMPSPANYEKAVSLIKVAVSLDSSGSLERAFQLYTASLRYLVPCVAAESDAVRRAALRGKLTRYMERAEEIKSFLKGGQSQATHTLGQTDGQSYSGNEARVYVCEKCTHNIDSCVCAEHTGREEIPENIHNVPAGGLMPPPPAASGGGAPLAVGGAAVAPPQGGGAAVAPPPGGEAAVAPPPGGGAAVAPPPGPRGSALRRLFRRHSSIPLLDNKDSTISDAAQVEDKNHKETDNDACRIT